MKLGTEHELGWLFDLTVVALSSAIFMALAFHQIHLPGLHTDEALEVLPAMQLVLGQEVECFKDVCLEVLGLRLPVMIYEYIATVNTYMAIPFFLLFGVNVPSLRAMPILQSVAAIVFLYLFARELFNRRVASLTVLLISVSPSFVFWSRQGVFVTSVTIPISLAAAWAWLRWWRTSRAGYLYLGAFLSGLGASAKFLFIWLLAGVGGAFLLLNWGTILVSFRKRSTAPLGVVVRPRDLAIGGALFVVGLLPLIIFNVETMSTINYIRANVSGASYYQVDNTNVAENLRERIKELRSVLNGETFWYLGVRPYASWRYPSVFLIAIGVLAFSTLGSKGHTWQQTIPSWVTVAAVVIPSYVGLFFVPVHEPVWYPLLAGIGLAGTALTGLVLVRGQGPRFWLEHLLTGISASALFILFTYLAWKLTQWYVAWPVYTAGVIALVAAPWLRGRKSGRAVFFPVLVIGVMLTCSVFTPTALWFTHLAILTPWPILSIVAIADWVVRRSGLDALSLARFSALGTRHWAGALSLGLAGLLALTGMLMYDDLEVNLAYHRELGQIGGKGDHTHASYRLVEYLEGHGLTNVVAMDWGIQDVVQFLSQGRITPPEIFGYERHDDVDPAFSLRVRQRLDDPEVTYVFRVQPHFLNRWETFKAIVAKEGRKIVEDTLIYDWAAIPIYRIVHVTS